MALKQGDLEKAVVLFRESLASRQETAELPGIADCLGVLAVIAIAQGHPERAARLTGQAAGLRESTRTVHQEPDFRSEYEQHRITLREALGSEAFAAAMTQGRSMSPEQAIAYALEDTASLPLSRTSPLPPGLATTL